MSLAKITIIGFENWLNHENKSLFDSLLLPPGIDKETLTNNILLNLGEFEVLYSDPYAMQSYIGVWGKTHFRTFEKWVNALSITYNPLENYDRMEEWTDKNNSTSGNHTETTNTDNTLNKVTAYDSDTFHDRDSMENESSSIGDSNGTFDSDGHHVGRVHGNIGVTTNQQMLQSELELAMWNIYEQITDLFSDAFCILVYE